MGLWVVVVFSEILVVGKEVLLVLYVVIFCPFGGCSGSLEDFMCSLAG